MTLRKIIFIHLLNDYSGSPKVLSQVIKASQKSGKECLLYTGKSEDGFLSGLVKSHYHYFYKRFDNKYLTLVTFMLSQIILFFKLLKYWHQDVLIYVNTMLPFGAALAGKLMGKSVYYHIHETSLQPASFKRFLRFMVQKSASKIIFVSKSVQEAESFLDVQQEVVYNALPHDLANIAEKFHYDRNGVFNVLMICSLKGYKGVEEFVEIARQCIDQAEITFTLVLNAEHSEINAYFGNRELSSNIQLVARQNNLVPYYKQAGLLLNLSRVDEWVETFGLTIIEAMAFGIPVIVPPVGGPSEIVSEGREGYLISSYETETIAKTIMSLSKDKDGCIALSTAARKRVEDFKEDRFEEKIVEVIYG